MQVALTKARVRGDVLTVELQYGVGPSADNTPDVYTKVDQVNSPPFSCASPPPQEAATGRRGSFAAGGAI